MINLILEYITTAIIGLNGILPAIAINALPFILLLGVLVFVHELGHFAVAKLFGIRVDEFSFGFPPKLFGKKIGETEYIVSLLPVGGYVKLAGQDDFGKVQINSQDTRMYFSKPAWQRFLVVFTGPAANFAIGWLIFTLLYVYGMNVDYNPAAPGKIGVVFDNSAAQRAGLQPGDEILKVGDKKIESWNDLLELSVNPQAEAYQVIIKRGNMIIEKSIAPQKNGKRYVFGISQYQPSVIGATVQQPDEKSGIEFLRPGDEIVEIDGRAIEQWESIVECNFLSPSKPLDYKIKRAGNYLHLTVTPVEQKIETAGYLGFEFKTGDTKALFKTTNIIEKINDAELTKLDLRAGDKIINLTVLKNTKSNIDGVQFDDYDEVADFKILSGYEFGKILMSLPDTPLKLKIERAGAIIERVAVSKRRPVSFGYVNLAPKEYIESYSFGNAFVKSLGKTRDFIVQTFQIIGKIFTKKMAASDALGGPITMWKMTVITVESGYRNFLMLMALISINLGFINLLPIPAIDGGHIVIYIYEMIIGKMPSEKALNVIQQIGFAAIIFLMAFTFYIDIAKMF